MRFSCKKMIALVLSLMLVLSTFTGVLSVSAADSTIKGNISIGAVDGAVSVIAETDKTFAVDATVTLDAETSYLELAYEVSGLPEGVTLTAVALKDEVVGTAVIEKENVVYVNVPGAVTTFAVTMTFTATEIFNEGFEFAFGTIDYADITEEVATLETKGGTVNVTFHQASGTWVNDKDDGGFHYQTCVVEGCTQKFNRAYHDWIFETTKEPTCCVEGIQYKHCSVCKTGWGNFSIAATGEHAYAYNDNGDGTHKVVCETSTKVLTEAEAHTYSEGVCEKCQSECQHAEWDEVIDKDATCTEVGSKTCTCKACGIEQVVEIPVIAHAYDAVVTDPTCTEAGYTTYTCSVCGDSYVADETEATGHTEEVIPAVAATCTATGLTEGKKCSVCGEILVAQEEVAVIDHVISYTNNGDDHTANCANCDFSQTEGHTYVDGTCVCGATETASGPVLDESLVFSSTVVTVTSTVNIRYRVRKVDYPKYSSFKVVVYGKEYSFVNGENLYNEVDVPETEVNLTNSTTNVNTYLYEGIAMCSLGLDMNAYIKCYDANGNYVAHSPVFKSSPETLLKELLASTQTDIGKTAITELLNMAAAAQVQFAANKSGTDLATAVAEGKLVNNGVDQTYTVKEMPTLNTEKTVIAAIDSSTGEARADAAEFITNHKITSQVSLIQAPVPRFYIGTATNHSTKPELDLDKSKIKMVFSYYDPDPNVKATVTKTVDGSTAEGLAAIVTSGKRYAIDVPSFEFHNANQTITATLYYDGAEMATATYSVETYVSEQIASTSASENAKNMATAIAKFGLAFRNNKGITT